MTVVVAHAWERPVDAKDWEPAYGYCADGNTAVELLALTVEMQRRKICYDAPYMSQYDACDCVYGRTQALLEGKLPSSRQTGCPELRELVYRLMHGQLGL